MTARVTPDDLTLGKWEAVALWWHGRADRRRGASLAPFRGASVTPHLEAIYWQAVQACTEHREAMVREIGALRQQEVRLRSGIVALELRLTDAEGRLAAATAATPDRGARLGEEGLDEITVTRRRRREQAREIRVLTDEVAVLRKDLEEIRAEAAALLIRTDRRRAETREQLSQVRQLAQRRMAAYWRSFVRGRRRQKQYPAWSPRTFTWDDDIDDREQAA